MGNIIIIVLLIVVVAWCFVSSKKGETSVSVKFGKFGINLKSKD